MYRYEHSTLRKLNCHSSRSFPLLLTAPGRSSRANSTTGHRYRGAFALSRHGQPAFKDTKQKELGTERRGGSKAGACGFPLAPRKYCGFLLSVHQSSPKYGATLSRVLQSDKLTTISGTYLCFPGEQRIFQRLLLVIGK